MSCPSSSPYMPGLNPVPPPAGNPNAIRYVDDEDEGAGSDLEAKKPRSLNLKNLRRQVHLLASARLRAAP